jgi:hypothetical protein
VTVAVKDPHNLAFVREMFDVVEGYSVIKINQTNLFRSLQMTHKCSGKWWILLAGSKFYF